MSDDQDSAHDAHAAPSGGPDSGQGNGEGNGEGSDEPRPAIAVYARGPCQVPVHRTGSDELP